MMCSKSTIPLKISDNEDVARIIFAPSMIIGENVSPSAFYLDDLPNGPETYISVWRSTYVVPSRTNVKFNPRKAGDKLVGYATIGVKTCHSIQYKDYSLRVKAHANKHPEHAGIHIKNGEKAIKGKCNEPGFLRLALLIVQKCTLTLFDAAIADENVT